MDVAPVGLQLGHALAGRVAGVLEGGDHLAVDVEGAEAEEGALQGLLLELHRELLPIERDLRHEVLEVTCTVFNRTEVTDNVEVASMQINKRAGFFIVSILIFTELTFLFVAYFRVFRFSLFCCH